MVQSDTSICQLASPLYQSQRLIKSKEYPSEACTVWTFGGFKTRGGDTKTAKKAKMFLSRNLTAMTNGENRMVPTPYNGFGLGSSRYSGMLAMRNPNKYQVYLIHQSVTNHHKGVSTTHVEASALLDKRSVLHWQTNPWQLFMG